MPPLATRRRKRRSNTLVFARSLQRPRIDKRRFGAFFCPRFPGKVVPKPFKCRLTARDDRGQHGVVKSTVFLPMGTPTSAPDLQPDCMVYPCHQECCSEGCDVWPRERAALLTAGLAAPSDFSEPYVDDAGDTLYRTSLSAAGGCVFLLESRGCRLHSTGLKPEVCILAPRSEAEADEMQGEGMLPCRQSWHY